MNYDFRPFENYMARTMETHRLPGTAVAVAKDGEPVYVKGFGFRDAEKKLRPTGDTVFGIGSITKSFTAIALMQLVEEGKLSVEDPIVKYYPEFKAGKTGQGAGITLHHFLTHTSGFPALPTLFAAMARSMKADPHVMESSRGERIKSLAPVDTMDEMLAFIASLDIEMHGTLGQYFSYFNEGWAVLGAVVAKVAGRKYEDIIQERVLRPLGMGHSTFSVEALAGFPEVATLYDRKKVGDEEQVVPAPVWWESNVMAPAGFLKSSVLDLLKYLEVYRTRGTSGGARVLSADSIDRMTALHTRAQGGSYYGYGLSLHPNYHGVSLIEHGGGIKGVSAHISCAPEKGITVAVLTNLSGVPSQEMSISAMNVMLGLPVGARRQTYEPYACPDYRLPRYMGEYRSGEGANVKVSLGASGLEIELEGKRFAARPVAVDTFAITMKDEERVGRFLVNPAGAVWAIEFGGRLLHKATATA
ncbi:MAG: serine hydrolase [Bacillota bacterium]|nr:serine hydrolase [Bacillota bacterium]